MTIFEKLQKKLAEHTAMYGDLPDYIVLTDEEYGELVDISDKNYQPKANDQHFWGVPIVVSDSIEEFTFAYHQPPSPKTKDLKWLIGENANGIVVQIDEYVKILPNIDTYIIVNGEKIPLKTNELIAPILAKLAMQMNRK